MAIALRYALDMAPWLGRSDAVASHRRRSLLGLSHQQLESWLDSEKPGPITLGGRLGAMLRREIELTGAGLVAMEWDLVGTANSRASIVVPPSPEDEDEENGWTFELSGRIDRIDVLPQAEGWLRKAGFREPMPLDLDFDDDDPSLRHIIIREVKSIEGPGPNENGKRHQKAILQEVQLALYARAWELANPGDRVVAVGVSEIGEDTSHWLEIDESVLDSVDSTIADEVTQLGAQLHRRRGESPSQPRSVPFRAWLRHRLEISGRSIEAAESGLVHPTPSHQVCGYCPVSMACGFDLSFSGGFS